MKLWQRWRGIFMAILKHIANKNADYGETQRYLIFRYDECHRENLYQVVLFTKAERNVTEKEYLRTSIEKASALA